AVSFATPVGAARTPLAIRWSRNNSKLKKLQTIGFGIPAGVSESGFNTCPAKGLCAGFCYARQGWYVIPQVATAREANLRLVRRSLDTFVELAVGDLRRELVKLENRREQWLRQSSGARFPGRARREPPRELVVRVHDSGDFFSADYLRAWFTIAMSLPEITFYAYTKMFHRLRTLFAWGTPDNFRIVQSVGGKDDDKIDVTRPHARVFTSHDDRIRAGYADGTIDDSPAINGVIRIGLVYHGSRGLKPAQERALRVLPIVTEAT
ncbi:MAG TPA: hypothetical protein VEA38_20795, partial [Terriglobales bacterium]|nr:hypothetical protein [Terriglobales bacterium]